MCGWIAAEEHVAACTMDQWMQHIVEKHRKDRLGTAIREAELEGWHDRAASPTSDLTPRGRCRLCQPDASMTYASAGTAGARTE